MLMPFPCHSLVRRQALRALREGRESSQEGGNTGRRAMQPYRPQKGRPSVQLPAGIKRRGGFIRGFRRGATRKSAPNGYRAAVLAHSRSSIARIWSARRTAIAGAVAQALRPRRFGGEVLVAVERVEELLQASGEQHLLESRIGMRARKLRFVNHMIHG